MFQSSVHTRAKDGSTLLHVAALNGENSLFFKFVFTQNLSLSTTHGNISIHNIMLTMGHLSCYTKKSNFVGTKLELNNYVFLKICAERYFVCLPHFLLFSTILYKLALKYYPVSISLFQNIYYLSHCCTFYQVFF